MQTKILLSIKPHFAERIFTGTKHYEFRRVLFRATTIKTVVVYASSPIQRVIGEFTVGGILALSTQRLWKETRRHAGIEKRDFDSYFNGRKTGYAIKVSQPMRYHQPKRLNHICDYDRPPQSFRYLR
jgi:predicted transcriptional regulator